jgi:hypothetical protein
MNKDKFEAWYDDGKNEPLPNDYDILGKRYLWMGWQAGIASVSSGAEPVAWGVTGDAKDFANKVVAGSLAISAPFPGINQPWTNDKKRELISVLDKYKRN